MVTILGAGGAIGNDLVKELAVWNEPIRLVGRSPNPMPGTAETLAADLSNLDDAVKAVAGCRIAFLVAGLKYDLKLWRDLWPRIMRNAIEASKRANAKLLFFDNVYMYGKVNGPMTEETPFRPSSKKGGVRAEIATMLLDEIKAGSVTGMIARAPDFYGPGVKTGVPNVLIFDKLAAGATPMWLVNDVAKHSFAFTPDASRSLVLLAEAEYAWNQTWHVPTASDPPTAKQLVQMAAKELGKPPKCRVLPRPMVWLGGLLDATVRESYEMLYQYETDYIFDSSKFEKAFNFRPTPYAEGVHKSISAPPEPQKGAPAAAR